MRKERPSLKQGLVWAEQVAEGIYMGACHTLPCRHKVIDKGLLTCNNQYLRQLFSRVVIEKVKLEDEKDLYNLLLMMKGGLLK